MLGVPGHVDNVVKDRASEEERELHAPNRCIEREERVLEACANSPGRATRTALRDCMASWLSCASMPKRKMGRLYTGAANALVTKDIACEICW